MFSIHWTFNYSNRVHRLLLQWWQISGEIPPRRAVRNYEVVGISREENHKFWLAEKRLNYIWLRATICGNLLSTLIFSVQFFLIPFDVDMVTYAFFQLLNIGHLGFHLFGFTSVVYTMNVFLLTLVRFFRLKFRCITGRIERLHVSCRKRVNNRKLARLLYEFNVIHLELFAMRDLFKGLIGYNLSHYFILALLTTFACLFADRGMAVEVLFIIYALGLATTFPFYFATGVINEVPFSLN